MTEVVRYSFKGERKYAVIPNLAKSSRSEVYDVTQLMLKSIEEDKALGHNLETGPCFANTINKTIKAMKLYEDLEGYWVANGASDEDRPRVGIDGQWTATTSVHPTKTWSW
jgi:hypothetical protein